MGIEQHRIAVRDRLVAAGAARSGPGSVSWAVNREVIVVAGWGRAILLQLAHPLVGQISSARELTDKLLAHNRAYLPWA